ncbi:hypothetical protein D3C84_990000 [compost metagenome]
MALLVNTSLIAGIVLVTLLVSTGVGGVGVCPKIFITVNRNKRGSRFFIFKIWGL